MQATTRPHSIYCFTCLCGREISSESTQTECPWCHREIRLVWPADAPDEGNSEPVKTLRASIA
jgi:Zn finger protein HypA/HybF involved in hydrogenase expression